MMEKKMDRRIKAEKFPYACPPHQLPVISREQARQAEALLLDDPKIVMVVCELRRAREWRDHAADYAARGLTLTHRGEINLERLVGKRKICGSVPCFDHTFGWNLGGRLFLIETHPYHAHHDNLKALLDRAEELGLYVSISTHSWYGFGTLGISVMRKGTFLPKPTFEVIPSEDEPVYRVFEKCRLVEGRTCRKCGHEVRWVHGRRRCLLGHNLTETT